MATLDEKYKSLYPENPHFYNGDNGRYAVLERDVRFTDLGNGQLRFNLGKDGKTAVFTSNNPYLSQLATSENAQDVSAIMEMAIKWEADWATTLENRSYNQFQEEINKQRTAGINPDLSGGSSSSSGGTSSSPMQHTPEASTKFANPYDDTTQQAQKHTIIQGYINSAVGIAQTAIGGVKELSMLGPVRSLAQTQAYVADKTKDHAVQSSMLGNVSSHIANFEKLASMFTPEMSEEDMNGILTSIGYPAEQIPEVVQTYRQAQKNPHLQAYFNTGELARRKSQAENQVYTSDLCVLIADNQAKYEVLKSSSDYFSEKLRNSLSKAMSNPQQIDDAVSIALNEQKTTLTQSKTAVKQAEYDAQVFDRQLTQIADAVKFTRKKRQVLIDKINKGQSLTSHEQAFYDASFINEQSLLLLGTEQFNTITSYMMDIARQSALFEYSVDDDGDLNDKNILATTGYNFINSTFSNQYLGGNMNLAGAATAGAAVTGVGASIFKTLIKLIPK